MFVAIVVGCVLVVPDVCGCCCWLCLLWLLFVFDADVDACRCCRVVSCCLLLRVVCCCSVVVVVLLLLLLFVLVADVDVC